MDDAGVFMGGFILLIGVMLYFEGVKMDLDSRKFNSIIFGKMALEQSNAAFLIMLLSLLLVVIGIGTIYYSF